MLQSQTVTRETLELLIALMKMPELRQFSLVGGTNLSLRFGHRLSIDLDLFTNDSFDTELIFNKVRLVSVEDIAAMKLSAVARRGVKKDFWDIAELLERFSIQEMIDFYKEKILFS